MMTPEEKAKGIMEKYRLMIYFAIATIHLYSEGIKTEKWMRVEDFIVMNAVVIQRICDEAKNIFNYELSFEQIRKACYCYLQGQYHPQNVNETEAYTVT